MIWLIELVERLLNRLNLFDGLPRSKRAIFSGVVCSIVLADLFIFGLSAQDSPEAPGVSKRELRISDPRIDESSGLAKSRIDNNRWWTHNDSGDKPRLFGIDIAGESQPNPEGTNPAVSVFAIEIEHAKAVDWEDMTAGEIDGKNVLWIGDIGDNGARRPQVQIYLVDEPSGKIRDGDKIAVRRSWAIEYEDGPRDCEAMAFDSEGRAVYLLAKGRLPWAGMYRVTLEEMEVGKPFEDGTARAKVDDESDADKESVPSRVIRAKRIASLPIAMATGMDIRRDGLQIAICTYFDCWVFNRAADERWEEALGRLPTRYELPRFKQIEAIAYAGDGSLWVTSEGEPMRLEVIPCEP